MIREIIKKRLSLSGFSQAELGELIGVTPAQMSLYLSGKSSLSHESLEKLLNQMDINLECYDERLKLAEETAKALKGKKTPEEVIRMDKEEMISLSNIERIKYLIDVQDSEEFNAAIGSGLMDADIYYIHFRMITAHILQLISDGEITAKRASQSVSKLNESVSKLNEPVSDGNKNIGAAALTGLALIGVGAIVALAQIATGFSGRPTGIWSSFTALASKSHIKKTK